MASRMTKLTRIATAALVIAPALLSASGAFAQERYGPYSAPRVDGPRHPGRAWRDGYCGERASVQAPDIMNYDRNTHSEVLVGAGPGASTQVTGLNRDTGSTYSVQGDLNGPQTQEFCTANGVTGSAYSITSARGGAEVKGFDGETGRRFEVSQGPGGQGPDFKSIDPRTGRSALVITGPDGVPIVREFGPHALACTRLRLGFGANAEVGPVEAGTHHEAHLGLGDC
jgi:hypothetical protein